MSKSMTPDEPKNKAKDIASSATDASERAVGTAKDALGRGAEQLRDYAARTGAAAGETYGKAQDRVRDVVGRMPENAAEAMDAAQRSYDRGSKTVGRQVSQQPIEALLLAGAIGYLVGWATNRV